MDANITQRTEPDLVVAGTITDAPGIEVDLVVAIETVVPDDQIPEVLGLYCTRVRTDERGRFTDRHTPSDDLRCRLQGWVMCTVLVQPCVPGAGDHCKVVRWHRPSSVGLITGLSALLASVSFSVRAITRQP
jgi:hypothetical protein